MSVYTFVNGVRKRAFTYHPRVKVNGAIKKIIGAYTFTSGTRHKIFGDWSFENEHLFLSNATVELPAGTYRFVLRGGGGASGTRGQEGNKSGYAAGSAGAGGKGQLVVQTITKTSSFTAKVYVGIGGQGRGNGGAAGISYQANGGEGGDGGKPSFIVIDESVISANGGGGGGGGGGSAWNGRNADGGGGGGGGGFYKALSTLVDDEPQYESIAGKKGSNALNNGAGVNGVAGNTTDFPNIYSGGGGKGYSSHGYASSGANGGGASGGSGGTGGDHSGVASGSGGGGAGGDLDAGGGNPGVIRPGGTAYNHHIEPTDTLSENAAYGVNFNYGIGGMGGYNTLSHNNGSQGFVLITRLS